MSDHVKIYTWKDVERIFYMNQYKWKDVICDIDVYEDKIYIDIRGSFDEAGYIIEDIFQDNYNSIENKIYFDILNCKTYSYLDYLDVVFEKGDKGFEKSKSPLFKKIVYESSEDREELYNETWTNTELVGVPVIAFYSSTRGVDHSRALIAFAKAWLESRKKKNDKMKKKRNEKLMIVDAEIEEPDITFRSLKYEKYGKSFFSYLDLIELIQSKNNVSETVQYAKKIVENQSIDINSDNEGLESIIFLPAYRYSEQLFDKYATPQTLAESYNKKYSVSETLSLLGAATEVAMVLVDLQSGFNESSAPLLFDPRVKKYIVTTKEEPSIGGTELLLKQLNKGITFNVRTKFPEILLTKTRKYDDLREAVNRLLSCYNSAKPREEMEDLIITKLPYIGIETCGCLKGVSGTLRVDENGKKFYEKMYQLVTRKY